MKVKHLLFSIIVAAFLSSAISFDKKLEVGSKAPEIENIIGDNVGYDVKAEQKNKLVSFWNPKNPASRIANRKLNLKYGSNNEENIEFISISTDPDSELMAEVMKIDGINADKVFSYQDVSSRVFKDYGVENAPRAFKISPDGKILQIYE